MLTLHTHPRPTEAAGTTSIKTALGAGLGSSLFMFHGLSNISSHIFREASLTSPSPSPLPEIMGSCHSTAKNGSTSSRPGSEHAPLMSRPQKHSRTFSSQSSESRSSKHRHRGHHLRGHRDQQYPKAEFRLRLQCIDCARRGVTCMIAPDLNCNGNTLAYRAGSGASSSSRGSGTATTVGRNGQPQLKDWTLAVDFCGWSRSRETALAVLGKHMRVSNEKECRPFQVEELLTELEEKGVRFISSIGGEDHDATPEGGDNGRRGPVNGWERV